LIGVTAPYCLQSHDAGGSASTVNVDSSTVVSTVSNDGENGKHPFKAPNSSVFKSAYSFNPTVDVYVGSAFQA
jgi:hypothetical protein